MPRGLPKLSALYLQPPLHISFSAQSLHLSLDSGMGLTCCQQFLRPSLTLPTGWSA
ncbi:hypothetical protein MBAV_002432 [Candidatus Magnetobacterium bavaricum]|uniref:Uncharacterized protein n=1 Tax=Candidatus Magnetobacterium bavaricum TaxID=29290 RepID=A0A0F3GTW4_9BACT|nr:hypothetical protein MBAV_002432 [Candidatus Magnetobacterium bavaricum]